MDFSEATDKPLPREVARAITNRQLPGRPSSLTPDVAEQIVEYVRKGAFLNAAGGRVGVHGATVRDWIRRGIADAQAELVTPFSTFAQGIAQAQADHEAELAATFTRGGDGKYPDWRAQAFLAERRYEHWRLPKDNGQKVEITLTLTGQSAAVLEELLRAANAKQVTTDASCVLPTASVIDRDTSE